MNKGILRSHKVYGLARARIKRGNQSSHDRLLPQFSTESQLGDFELLEMVEDEILQAFVIVQESDDLFGSFNYLHIEQS